MLYPKDASVSVVKTTDSIELKWNWYRMGRAALLANPILFAAIGLGGLLVPEKPGQVTPHFAIMMFWFFLLVLVPGMTLFTLIWFVNKSVVRASKHSMRIHSTLFPWFKPIEFSCEGIIQFFVTQSKSSNEKVFTLYCIDASSNFHFLGEHFASEIAAHQVCHELQDFYGLEDLPVYGQNTQPHQPGPRIRSSNT